MENSNKEEGMGLKISDQPEFAFSSEEEINEQLRINEVNEPQPASVISAESQNSTEINCKMGEQEMRQSIESITEDMPISVEKKGSEVPLC
jgi:hypothetical protein